MKELKLKNLLKDTSVHIEYRTFGPNGEDLLVGFCYWDGKELIPIDYDIYSVEDPIEKCEWDQDEDLTVWIKSTWVTG